MNSRRLHVRLALTAAALVCLSGAEAAAQTTTFRPTWTHVVNVSATGDMLRKTGGCSGCADAGATSVEEITSDGGHIEFVPTLGSRFYVGLSADRSPSTDPATIDFAFSFWAGGTWDIRERGTYRKEGAFVQGDVFRIAVVNGAVRFYHNGVERYASTVTPTFPLGFDTTFYTAGAELTSASMRAAAPAPPAPTPSLDDPPATYGAITDRTPRVEPPLPTIGGAGFTFTDPTFGSRMLRVTDGMTRLDARDRSYKTPSASHQNAWNTTGRLFYVLSSGSVKVPFAFDPATLTASRINPTPTGSGGLVLNFFGEPQFSYARDNLIYGIAGSGTLRTIQQYDFAANAYSMLLDLDTLGADLTGTYVGGIQSSAGPVEKIMAWYGGTSQDRHYRLVVFDRANPSQRRVVDTLASTIDGVPTATLLNFKLHHAEIDRSGRYVMLSPTTADRQAPRYAAVEYIWDMQTDAITPLDENTALAGGHKALGFGTLVNKSCCTSTTWDAAQWQFRWLDAPLTTRDIINPILTPKEVFLSDHPSWHNARDGKLLPFVSALYRYGNNTTEWRAWDDEIVAIQTELVPSATVWRFAHHRSDVGSDADPLRPYFWYMPRVNVSQDGRWAIFTSNWEKTLGIDPILTTEHRQDVFLVELPTAAKPVPNQPPTVSITAPADGAVLTEGAVTNVAADATDVDGAVVRVDFFVNGSLVGSASAAPFGIPWTVPVAGTYRLTAAAVDNAGATTTSPAVTITVVAPEPPNEPPTVTITAPAAGSAVTIGSTVIVTASASDADGVVTRVDFFANGVLVGSDTVSPFEAAWAPSAAGSYALTATAVDDDAAEANSGAVALTVTDVPMQFALKVGTVYDNKTGKTYGASSPHGVEPVNDANSEAEEYKIQIVSGTKNWWRLDYDDPQVIPAEPDQAVLTIHYRPDADWRGTLTAELYDGTLRLGSVVLPVDGRSDPVTLKGQKAMYGWDVSSLLTTRAALAGASVRFVNASSNGKKVWVSYSVLDVTAR